MEIIYIEDTKDGAPFIRTSSEQITNLLGVIESLEDIDRWRDDNYKKRVVFCNEEIEIIIDYLKRSGIEYEIQYKPPRFFRE